MISEELLKELQAELEADEGFVSHAYPDSRGYWTIGIGRLIDKRLGGGISHDEALYLLENDVAKAEKVLNVLESRWHSLDSDRQLVLLNLAFNLGPIRLAGFKRFWAAIRDFLDGKGALYLSVAADEMLASEWASQVGKRATRLADRMRVTSTS